MNTTIKHNFDNMTSESLSSTITMNDVVAFLFRISLISIGTFLNLKIIPVCRNERDKVWLINITRSVAAICLVIHAVIFEALTDYFPGFSEHIGVSICYLTAFMYVYLPYMIGFDSLFVSIIKYMFIVHYQKSMNYGEEKIQKRFFWLNLLHPVLPSIITVFLFDFEGFASLTSCFGLEDRIQERYNSSTGNIERMFLCKLRTVYGEDLGTQVSYTLAQCFCATKMVFNLGLMSNIPEAYFYYKIFRKMKRYQ